MRTIAICEDVDRGQSDIKKLRKENEHLKREIWGLRDECEKLEEILKKVCISANIPDFDLDISKKNREEDSDDDEEEDDDEEYDEDASSYGGSDQHLKIDGGGRQRKESCVSVVTIDSDVGNCMTTMFGDDPGGGGAAGGQESGFAVEDPGSAIMNPECSTSASAMMQSAEVICHPYPTTTTTEPVPSTSFAQQQQMSWSHPTAVPPDLECVKEETDSAISSPTQMMEQQLQSCLEPLILPDPNLITFPPEVMGASAPPQQDVLYPADGRKTPVIQITPASSPASNGNGTDSVQSEPQSPTDNVPLDPEPVHNIGCITVVPKTFKVTSEIVVGDEGSGEGFSEQYQSKSEELPRKILKLPPLKQDSGHISSDHIVLNQYSLHGPHHTQRRSCYFPSTGNHITTTSSATAQTLPASTHRSFGMLTGYSCCCSVGDEHLVGGYQSEPSLNHATVLSSTAEEFSSILNPFQCCRVPPVAVSPMTLRSVWNTVDKNIVIGFYGISGGGGGGDTSIEPKVQEIIDELESQFDPTLENIQGIRLIPGRIFISVKNATLVKSFLTHFKNDLVLTRKNTQQRIRIHFIEGASQKVTTTLVLSGIPPELSDLAVISSLNQFGQVVAPLERRNYKGVDISERIAKMHLVIGEGSLLECINVNGYNVRIKKEHQDQLVQLAGVETPTAPKYYGFVPPNQNQTVASTIANGTAAAATSASPTLNPHKPVIRSSSSAPRLETPAPGTLICPLPTVEQKRQSSVCVGNIPTDQHPSKVMEKQQGQAPPQHKVTIAQQSLNQSHQSMQGSSTPNLQPPPKKPLARLLVSSPGSFTASPPVSSPVSPVGAESAGQSGGGGALKAFYRSFDPRRGSSTQGGGASSIGTHAPLTPSSSYSPRTRRKSSVQFAGKGGKREPLPWCGCWGLGCGN